jgi:predicted DNA-binding transcriptional regulator AlpA
MKTSATKKIRFMKWPEVRDRIGVSYPTLRDWMRAGTFPLSREIGNRVVWIEQEILDWMASRPVKIRRRSVAAPEPDAGPVRKSA